MIIISSSFCNWRCIKSPTTRVFSNADFHRTQFPCHCLFFCQLRTVGIGYGSASHPLQTRLITLIHHPCRGRQRQTNLESLWNLQTCTTSSACLFAVFPPIWHVVNEKITHADCLDIWNSRQQKLCFDLLDPVLFTLHRRNVSARSKNTLCLN